MNTNEFDPTNVNPEVELTDEQRFNLQQIEEQRKGDENEANGLNRDGSPKEKPAETPAKAPVTKNAGPASLDELRDLKIQGVKDSPVQGTNFSKEELSIKEILSKQEKLPIFLPLEPGERRGEAYRSVSINGYRFEVKKGIIVNVPSAVHALLVNALDSTSQATEIEENLSMASGEKARALNV